MKVQQSDEKLSAQNIVNSLYGMQGMSSEYSEVREFLKVLTIKVKKSDQKLNAHKIGNALY